MNKRITILLFLLFFSTVSLFANNIESFSYEQLREYNSLKLSLDEQSSTMGSINRNGSFFAGNYKKWIPYEGTKRISDKLLFELAGYNTEAINTQRYENTKSIFIYGGTVATVVGIILLLSNQDENSFGFNAGIVTTSIGVGFVSGGIGMNFINRYPSNIADMAIQEYNKQLQENILNNSK